jgi:hypothetical protein
MTILNFFLLKYFLLLFQVFIKLFLNLLDFSNSFIVIIEEPFVGNWLFTLPNYKIFYLFEVFHDIWQHSFDCWFHSHTFVLQIHVLGGAIRNSYKVFESATFESFGVFPQNLNNIPTLFELLEQFLELLQPIGTYINKVLGFIDHGLNGIVIQPINQLLKIAQPLQLCHQLIPLNRQPHQILHCIQPLINHPHIGRRRAHPASEHSLSEGRAAFVD